MAKRVQPTFRIDCIRALLVVVFASALGFCANAFSPKPLAIFPKPAPVNPEKPPAPEIITVPELVAAQKANAKLLVLDVRSKYDFESGHVPLAYNLPLNELHEMIAAMAPTLQGYEILVTMCDGAECGMADEAAKRLRALGYADVRVLTGGIEAWRQARLDVVQEPH